MYTGEPDKVIKVRGKNYVKNSKKIPSESPVFHPVHVLLAPSNADEPARHICAQKGSFFQNWRESVRNGHYVSIDSVPSPSNDFSSNHPNSSPSPAPTTSSPSTSSSSLFPQEKCQFIVVNFMLPTNSPCNLCCFFARAPPPSDAKTEDYQAFEKLFQTFLDSDDTYKDNHFKFIPNVPDGPFIVRFAVGNTPALIGNKLKQVYHANPEQGYLEVDIDIGSSKIAEKLMDLAMDNAANLAIEFFFVIQGDDESVLPERLVGGVRVVQPDVACTTSE